MYYFKPDCLYKEETYKTLIPFYELGVGVLSKERYIQTSRHGVRFLSLCELVKRLFEDTSLRKSKWCSELHAIRVRMFVKAKIFRGVLIVFNARVSNILAKLHGYLRPSKKTLQAAQAGQDAIKPSSTQVISARRIFPTCVDLERRFDLLLNTIITMGADASPILRARQPTIVAETHDQGLDEIVPELMAQPTRYVVDEPGELPEEIQQPITEEAAEIAVPSFRDRAIELAEDEPAARRDRRVTEQAPASDASVPDLTPTISRKVDDLNAIITNEEYEKMLEREQAAERRRRKRRPAPPRPQSMDIEEETRYRPPVFRMQEESSGDEMDEVIRNRNIVVEVEVLAPPATPSHQEPRMEETTVSAASQIADSRLQHVPVVPHHADVPRSDTDASTQPQDLVPQPTAVEEQRDIEEETRYRPPVFRTREESSGDEMDEVIRNRNIIVQAEVHARPASPSRQRQRMEDTTVSAPSQIADSRLQQRVPVVPHRTDVPRRDTDVPTQRDLVPCEMVPAVVEERDDLAARMAPHFIVPDEIVTIEEPPEPINDVPIDGAGVGGLVPETRSSVLLSPVQRQATKRRLSDVSDSSGSESPSTKQRKRDSVYVHQYHMGTLKERFNRTSPIEMYMLPLEEFQLSKDDTKQLDLHHLMGTFNDYKVDRREYIRYRNSGVTASNYYEEIYGSEPDLEPAAPTWTDQTVPDIVIDEAEECDEEEVLDLLRNFADDFRDAPDAQTWQIMKDYLLESAAEEGNLARLSRKSSFMGVMAQRIREDLSARKQTLLPTPALLDVPTTPTRVSDARPSVLPSERVVEVVRSAPVTRRDDLLTVVDEPIVVEQALPEPTPVVEPPEENVEVVAHRRRLTARRASDSRVRDTVVAPPDEPTQIRQEVQVPAAEEVVESSALPPIADVTAASVAQPPRETLPADEPAVVPQVDAVAPQAEREEPQPEVVDRTAKIAAVRAPRKDETPIAELISKVLTRGEFVSKADPSLVIRFGLPSAPRDPAEWQAPIRRVSPPGEEVDEVNGEPVLPPGSRIFRRDVVSKLNRLLDENDPPIRFSALCPFARSTKYVAARSLFILLNMHYEELIRLETDSSRTSADAILIYPTV